MYYKTLLKKALIFKTESCKWDFLGYLYHKIKHIIEDFYLNMLILLVLWRF